MNDSGLVSEVELVHKLIVDFSVAIIKVLPLQKLERATKCLGSFLSSL